MAEVLLFPRVDSSKGAEFGVLAWKVVATMASQAPRLPLWGENPDLETRGIAVPVAYLEDRGVETY